MDTNALEAPQTTQESQDLESIERKQKLSGTVIKTTLAGAVIDVGLEVPGVVHISQLQAEPVNRVEDVVQLGQKVEVWVRRVVPKKKRLELTMIQPLDLEWREISKNMVVKGKVTRLEKFGAFVDIGAERPGLVHISEMTHDYIKSPGDVVKEGDEIEVKVLNVNRQKKQIKLSMKALEELPVKQVVQASSPNAGNAELKDEPVPTAMEVAMREAMERSKEKTGDESKNKDKSKSKSSDELENILSRTLKQKVRTK
jgi:small subunit ribosomal protein S1